MPSEYRTRLIAWLDREFGVYYHYRFLRGGKWMREGRNYVWLRVEGK